MEDHTSGGAQTEGRGCNSAAAVHVGIDARLRLPRSVRRTLLRGMHLAAPSLGSALHSKQSACSRRTAGPLRCCASHRHGSPAPCDWPGRRAAALGLLSAAVGVTLGGGRGAVAAAPSGLELGAAVKSVSRTRDTLLRLEKCDMSSAACAAELAAALAPLPEALPVVAASATDFGRPQMDLSIAVFALLDRADGASYDGPNPIINPADIERLEALEAETQEALDQATLLLTSGQASPAAIRALARKLDTIMGELPPKVLRQALK